MLSILVPIYNFDVVSFVTDLHYQATRAGQPFEILCYDDASEPEFRSGNRVVERLENVTYLDLPENLGRSRIRNRLAQDAAFPFLLFVDCDSVTVSKGYISNYLRHCREDAVIYGGRCYQTTPPNAANKYLRWHYGVERETFSAQERNRAPYRMFLTNNYLIPKSIQLSVPFNEQLMGYGHEDTLLGYDLKQRSIPIEHIDNPLCHIGLEDAESYLSKTEEGLRNLHFIISEGYADEDIKLYKYFNALRTMRLSGLVRTWFRGRKETIVRNLLSDRPRLRNFDLFKLGVLLEISS
ncbi:MAG: glycosyltransferase [Bacteroidota bacterium]